MFVTVLATAVVTPTFYRSTHTTSSHAAHASRNLYVRGLAIRNTALTLDVSKSVRFLRRPRLICYNLYCAFHFIALSV